MLPLTEQARSDFDEAQARDRFFQLEGLPYGYSNMLFSLLDTPNSNVSPFVSEDFLTLVFSIAENIYKPVSDLMLTEGLNKRLGTTGLNL